MTLQQKLRTFGELLADSVDNLHHYHRPNMTAPFCVWAEDGESESFHANNSKKEQAIVGTIDYYTKTEYDTVVDTIQATLENADDLTVAWRLNTVDYEQETNLIHWSWEWVIA